MHLRLAERRDAEAIRSIYNPEVLESTVTFDLVPRSLDDQIAWLDDHSGGHPAIVATDADGTVVGFGSLSPYRPRAAYSTTVEDSVYVHRDHRGAGIGHGAARASWFDSARHTASTRRSRGSSATTKRRSRSTRAAGSRRSAPNARSGRKFGRWLDVVLMQRML